VAAIPGSLFFAWCTLMAVAPLRHPRRLGLVSWISSAVPNELPFLFLYIVIASNVPTVVGRLDGSGSWISLAVAGLTSAGLLVVAGRSRRAGPVVERALADGLGPGWRSELDPVLAGRLRRHLPWVRILLVPWMFGRRDVERIANVAYGDDGTSNLLDVYRHRSHPSGAPTLVYLHGGGFRWGRKNREARPLLYHLASHGWTCISANYHLAPSADAFPRNLIDVKKIIAWIHSDGPEYGADPDTIFLIGASAGAHLTATAALTVNDPTFQPGFEDVDTSITAGIGLYGYYGQLVGAEQPPTTPLAYSGDAPPFFVVHGDQDTYTPPEGARGLVEHFRAVSSNPILYAELPGAQHSFDLFHSVRFETVIDAIEAFAASVRNQRRSTQHAESPDANPASIT
jgi:acetyl esterase/lipase